MSEQIGSAHHHHQQPSKQPGKQPSKPIGKQPSDARPSVVLTRPTTTQLMTRGLTRRCPWCGDRKAYFTSWWGRADYCRECGRGYRRGDDAFELGAVTINMIFTLIAILFSLLLMFWLMYGSGREVPTMQAVAIGAVLVAIAPIVFYPISFTTWQAVDLLMHGPTEEELSGGPDATL